MSATPPRKRTLDDETSTAKSKAQLGTKPREDHKMAASLDQDQSTHFEILKLHHINLINEIQETALMIRLYEQRILQDAGVFLNDQPPILNFVPSALTTGFGVHLSDGQNTDHGDISPVGLDSSVAESPITSANETVAARKRAQTSGRSNNLSLPS